MAMTSTLNSDDVAEYLEQHPQFFVQYADVLANIKLTSPLVGRAISLQERQTEILRDKIRQHELQLSQIFRNAKENEAIADKYQLWTETILRSKHDATLPRVLTNSLASQFAVSQVTLRLWNVAPEYQEAWYSIPPNDDLRIFSNSLSTPYCGPVKQISCLTWLPNSEEIRSMAVIPLFSASNVIPSGLLVLGSTDEARFTAAMSTDFLTHIGKIASAALSHLSPQAALSEV